MGQIIYPKGNSKHVVGVTAPSSGLGSEVFNKRFDLVKSQHERSGFKVIEGKCLRENKMAVSASSSARAVDFLLMWKDKNIDLIQPPWGGEFLIDILEHIDFESLKNNPTWLMGYSDISTLLFAVTTKTGIATVHGTNFIDSIDGQDELTLNSKSFLELSFGDKLEQKSSNKWQKEFTDFAEKIDAKFNLTEETQWRLLKGNSVEFKGRVIGGCFDTLRSLVGTPYGDLINFQDRYCGDYSTILYLENCEQGPNDFYRGLMTMKYAGWFDRLSGVVFGRNNAKKSGSLTYDQVIEKIFGDVNFPVVLNADIGHKPPQISIINGSVATFNVIGGKATIVQELI